jgi:RHS repeat-associated protein
MSGTWALPKPRWPIPWLVLFTALTVLSPVRARAQACPGDCDGDAVVGVDEIVLGVNIALRLADVSLCQTMDTNHDLEISVDELIAAVANALNRCPTPTPTSTPIAPATSAPTATPTATLGTGNSPPTAVDDAAATLAGESIHVVVLANDSDPDGDQLTVTSFTQPAGGTVGFANDVASYAPNSGFTGTDSFMYTVSDGHGGSASAAVTVVVNSLPPDPATVAPPPASGVTTTVPDASSFLYSGANAVQFGVAPDTIETVRAAVVRGAVKTRAGDALSGVRIAVLDHPEFGFTASRADGMFDIAVNGGGMLTIEYEKPGFCPMQRTINVPWQDYVMAPEVMMTPLDPSVTNVTFGAGTPFQVAESTMQADGDGARHTLILFTPGTTAALMLGNGDVQDVGSLHIRATEFTVGSSGPAAMPALLPPMSGYTYCVELSADEAMSAGATGVIFNQPVITYVENFLGFPVGTGVPVGIYDREKAVWLPSLNGRVVKILGVTDGVADVDTDGDDMADDGLGITADERQSLASVYSAGQSLWRVPVTHFSPEDSNWPYTIPPDAESPGDSGAGPDANDPLEDPCQSSGTIVECENQVLGDALPIVGTPYTLNYRSDRVPERAATRSIQLSGPSVPASLASISLHLSVAGRNFDQVFPASPNQETTFVWDKLDAYGRPAIGGQTLSGTIDYNYPTMYTEPGPLPSGFNSAGGTTLTANPTRQQINISQHFSTTIGEGLTDARTIGLGGWMLSVHHVFDPAARVMHEGNGSRRRAGSLARILTTVDLPGQSILFDVAVGPDGSEYVALPHGDLIVRVAPDGTQSVVAGNGTEGFNGDGIPATDAALGDPAGIAVGPDGSLYIAEESNNRIRRISPDGMISTVAGTGTRGFDGDGGPATAALLTFPTRVAVGTDSTIYFVDGVKRIRRVTPDGVISTVAGNGSQGSGGDGGPATAAAFNNAFGVAVASDGSFYIADHSNGRVRRVGPDGIIRTVADYTSQSGLPMAVAIAPDGSVLIGVQFDSARTPQVDSLRADGKLVTVAGGGSSAVENGIPATQANLVSLAGVAAGPDGSVFVAPGDSGSRLFRIGPALPGIEGTANLIASADGAELYVFDAQGRHERTLNALTGATLFEFDYDSRGLLSHAIEKTGGTDNVTTIQHDGAGNPTAIISPFGQVTTLTVDTNGFLATISNPAGETVQMTSSPGGLLASYVDPRGKTSAFSYDSLGRLALDAEPAGASQSLARVTTANAFTVTRTTALGRATAYQTENLAGNIQRRTITAPDGTQSQTTEMIDAGTTHSTASDGTTFDTALGPDPRFGMESPLTASTSVHFPSTLLFETTSTRSAVLGNGADPLSLMSLTETRTVEERTASATYTAATKTLVTTTPAGRTHTSTIDAIGRQVQGQLAGLNPVNLTYDDRGRLASLSSGDGADTRAFTFTYDAQGFVESITDPIGRIAHLAYDAAGRITSKTRTDGLPVLLGFDAAGNLTSLTPPGRPAYTFSYSDRNELTALIPPPVAGTGSTTYEYDADGALATITRPGNQTITLSYDSAGRPITRTLSTGSVTNGSDAFSYDAAGRIASLVAASGVTTTYAYDGALQTGATWSGPVNGSVTQTYDAGLRMASQSVDGADTIAFTYDDDDLLTGAGSLSLTRDPQHGLPISTTLGVVTSSLTYDGFGELSDYTASAGGSALYSVHFARDALGRISQKVEAVEGVTETYDYTYDVLGEVTSVTKDSITAESYIYDANGNRTDATVGGTTINATYDDQDRLSRYGSATFTYTAGGDLASRSDGAGTASFNYDAVGNLLGVTLPDATAITYVVDGRGRRVGKQVNGTLVQGFLYADSLRPAVELDGSGAVVSRFAYAGKSVPAFMIRNGRTFRLITDQVGSVRLVVDTATGTIIQRMDYDSFGNVLHDTNPGFQPFGFAGGLYDRETGLMHFGLRDYDPSTGHWTTADPLRFGAGETNLYAYVLNDPINRIDPSGLWGFGVTASANAEIGIGLGAGANASTGAGFFTRSLADAAEDAFIGLDILNHLGNIADTAPPPFSGSHVGTSTTLGANALGVLNYPNYSPELCHDRPAGVILGAAAGIGGGLFITNANTVNDLGGAFDSVNVNLPLFGVQVAFGGGIWSVALTAGVSAGGDVSIYPTNTWTNDGSP